MHVRTNKQMEIVIYMPTLKFKHWMDFKICISADQDPNLYVYMSFKISRDPVIFSLVKGIPHSNEFFGQHCLVLD